MTPLSNFYPWFLGLPSATAEPLPHINGNKGNPYKRSVMSLTVLKCNNCSQSKPLSDFSHNKNTPTGFLGECRACNSVSQKEYHLYKTALTCVECAPMLLAMRETDPTTASRYFRYTLGWDSNHVHKRTPKVIPVTPVTVVTKVTQLCKVCEKEQCFTEFFRSNHCKSGYRGKCKTCRGTRRKPIKCIQRKSHNNFPQCPECFPTNL